MTDRLRERLEHAAAEPSSPPVFEQTWQHARRQRRIAQLAAVVGTGLIVGATVIVFATVRDGPTPGADIVGEPSATATAPTLQASPPSSPSPTSPSPSEVATPNRPSPSPIDPFADYPVTTVDGLQVLASAPADRIVQAIDVPSDPAAATITREEAEQIVADDPFGDLAIGRTFLADYLEYGPGSALETNPQPTRRLAWVVLSGPYEPPVRFPQPADREPAMQLAIRLIPVDAMTGDILSIFDRGVS